MEIAGMQSSTFNTNPTITGSIYVGYTAYARWRIPVHAPFSFFIHCTHVALIGLRGAVAPRCYKNSAPNGAKEVSRPGGRSYQKRTRPQIQLYTAERSTRLNSGQKHPINASPNTNPMKNGTARR